jgi:polyisoprenoid-binding protein YceI
MQALPGQTTAPAVRALLTEGTLAGEWVLDPASSSIRLKSRVLGLIPVSGVFRDVSGSGTIGADGAVSGRLTVAAASIDTNHTKRDTHLRSADFFDTASNPDITFTTGSIQPSGQGVTVTGALTIRGQTRPMTFEATASADGDGEIGLDAELHINRGSFGLTWNVLGMASMYNTLTIHAVFTREATDA